MIGHGSDGMQNAQSSRGTYMMLWQSESGSASAGHRRCTGPQLVDRRSPTKPLCRRHEENALVFIGLVEPTSECSCEFRCDSRLGCLPAVPTDEDNIAFGRFEAGPKNVVRVPEARGQQSNKFGGSQHDRPHTASTSLLSLRAMRCEAADPLGPILFVASPHSSTPL